MTIKRRRTLRKNATGNAVDPPGDTPQVPAGSQKSEQESAREIVPNIPPEPRRRAPGEME